MKFRLGKRRPAPWMAPVFMMGILRPIGPFWSTANYASIGRACGCRPNKTSQVLRTKCPAAAGCPKPDAGGAGRTGRVEHPHGPENRGGRDQPPPDHAAPHSSRASLQRLAGFARLSLAATRCLPLPLPPLAAGFASRRGFTILRPVKEKMPPACCNLSKAARSMPTNSAGF